MNVRALARTVLYICNVSNGISRRKSGVGRGGGGGGAAL